MKILSFTTLALSLGLTVGPAIAGVAPKVAVNGVLPGGPPAVQERDIIGRGNGKECHPDKLLISAKNPVFAGAASSFCSEYLRPRVTATTTITTTVAIATTTELCATATSSVTCEVKGYGRCLLNPDCESFQVRDEGGYFCNLFNAPTEGHISPSQNADYTLYDRDCPQYLPAGCGGGDVKVKRAGRVPPPFATALPSRISSACSCLITSPAPPLTIKTVSIHATTQVTSTVYSTVA